MQTITTISLDIAKSVFQVHGVDVDGREPGTIAHDQQLLKALPTLNRDRKTQGQWGKLSCDQVGICMGA